jgi:hypothetical protein
MMNHEEFLFQRHLELWKDQNRLIKRVAILLLLFGFLVLFRVLIPFSQNNGPIVAAIENNQADKADIQGCHGSTFSPVDEFHN